MLAGACYSPTFPTGAPCDEAHPCPSALVCTRLGTCQRTDGDALDDAKPAVVDADLTDAPIDACVPTAEVCDDGIDQDCNGQDQSCAANDRPSGAVDVSAGGTFAGDLLHANDDLPEPGCNGAGGVDVFYKVTLAAPEVVYFDTFGSTADTTVRVYPGTACTAIFNNSNSTCNTDQCNTKQSQIAVALPSGTSCVVVDGPALPGFGAGTLSLEVMRAGRNGSPLGTGLQTKTGDTCTATDVTRGSCGDDAGAKDVAWYFLACPGQTRQLDATTCTDSANTHFDTVLLVRRGGAGGGEITCHDDDALCLARPERTDHPDLSAFSDLNLTGSKLYWLVLDGYGPVTDCGGYQLDTNLD